MQLPASDLEIIKTHPQSSELYLSIFQPRTIMTCIPNGASPNAIGARTINYVTGSSSSGSYLSIESGMTLLVGTSLGGRELGKIRIKSATATTFVVAENSNIQWPLAQYFTVLRYFEIWPVYPRIINDPGNVDNVIFYKDYDTTYTNQNTILGAFPNAGSHRAGFTGDRFYYTASGTYHLLGSALTYDWAFEGGTTTGSTSADPGYITYSTPGHYVTRLKVTGANGSVDTIYKYVSIYNRPSQSSANIPITKFNVDAVSGSRGEGGYNSSVKITDSAVDLHDGDIVVLFTDDYYGANHVSLGGNSQLNSSIFFVGGVLQDTIHYDYQTSNVDFQVGSVSDIMKTSEGFSVSVEATATPTKWFQLLDMDGRRAIYHYLKWHTTVLYTTDFEFRGTDQKIQYFDSDRQSMFDAIDNYMRGTLLGGVCTDRQGKLWAEVGIWAYSNPTGSFPPVMEITNREWLGQPTVTERLTPPLSFLELGGVAYSGTSTGTFSALISNAPGETPNTRGNVERQQGLALASQHQLNILTGNQFANKNATLPTIEMELTGKYSNLDIAPQETVDVNIPSGSTTRNISIHAPYSVDSMSWKYDSGNKVLIPQVTLGSVLSSIATGTTVTIPDVPEGSGYGGFAGGFNFNPTSGIGFPPFMSTLGSKSITKRHGTFSTPTIYVQPVIIAPFDTSLGDFQYISGGEFVSSTGTSSDIGYITNAGVYHINFKADVTIGGGGASPLSAVSFILYINGSTAPSYELPLPVAETYISFSWSEYYYLTTGALLRMDAGCSDAANNSKVSGSFYLTLELVS